MISVNVSEFTKAADFFLKHKCYTKAPKKSKEWYEFWREETKRCEEGYQVGNTKITGEHYFFLNYTPMKIAIVDGSRTRKESLFPKFNLLDYNWFWAKEISRWGITEDKLKSLDLYWKPNLQDALIGGKHLICAKTRGCGFSYKAAAHGVYNYNFIRKSKSFYFAAKEPFLWGNDGILLKAWDDLEWLNSQTDGWWRKNRMEFDNLTTKKASVKIKTPQGVEVKGYESLIGGIIVDNPEKVRGGRGELLVFEEAGSFKNLKKAIEISKPLVEDDTLTTGQIIMFGTGGEEGEGIEGLEDIFYSPEPYNFMRFENVWDENDLEEFGFFVPCTAYSPKFMDEHGNPKFEESKKEWEQLREKRKRAKDFKALDRLIAERPFNPAELFKRVSSNVFGDALYYVHEQIRNVENNKDVQKNIEHGSLYDNGKDIEFHIKNDVHPIDKYPHKNDDDLTGCITIYEQPERLNNAVPDYLYNAVVDPYAIETAEDKTSLGVCYIIKQNSIDFGVGDKIVAKFVGRPSLLSNFHRQIRYLAKYYNATIQSEIMGGGQSLLDYFRNKNELHLCEFSPNFILHGKELDKNQRNRSYFMSMPEDTKKMGLLYFSEWLLKERGVTADGRLILNVHLIYDLGLLQEIAKFSPDPKKNFDRVSAMILAMYMFKEKDYMLETVKRKSTSNFFKRQLFTGQVSYNTSNLDLSNEIAILNKDWSLN